VAAARPGQREKVKPPERAADPEEEAALARAVAVLRSLAPGATNPEAITIAVISSWIVERTRLSAGKRLTSNLAFDLGDSRTRGIVEAALPGIGAKLAHLPADKPFFKLEKGQVVDAFTAGIFGAHAAAVSLGELGQFPFDDVIPF
jgi:hypothetical protein